MILVPNSQPTSRATSKQGSPATLSFARRPHPPLRRPLHFVPNDQFSHDNNEDDKEPDLLSEAEFEEEDDSDDMAEKENSQPNVRLQPAVRRQSAFLGSSSLPSFDPHDDNKVPGLEKGDETDDSDSDDEDGPKRPKQRVRVAPRVSPAAVAARRWYDDNKVLGLEDGNETDDSGDEQPKDKDEWYELGVVQSPSISPSGARLPPGNQEQWYVDRGLNTREDYDLMRDDYSQNNRSALGGNLSGPSSGMTVPPEQRFVLSAQLKLKPKLNRVVVDRLVEELPNQDLGGGNVSVLSYPLRVKVGSQAVRNVYAGFVEVYRPGSTVIDYGRLYCQNGLQAIKGSVRRHLIHGLYEDVDISNAQPTFLLQLMAQSDYPLDYSCVERYVTERALCLQDVVDACENDISKDDAKTLFLSIMFGGNVRSWEEQHGKIVGPVRDALVVAFEAQVSGFVEYFMELHGDEIATHNNKTDAEIVAEGKSVVYRRFSLYMQQIEKEAMLHVMAYVQSLQGASVGALIHDGILAHIPGGAARHLDDISGYVCDKTGFSLAFAVKSTTPTETLDELIASLKGEPTNLGLPIWDPKDKTNRDMEFLDAFTRSYRTRLLFDVQGKIYHYPDGLYSEQGRGVWQAGEPSGHWWDALFPNTPYSQDANKMLSMSRVLKKRYPHLYQPLEWETYPQHWIPLRDCLVSLTSDETLAFTPEMMLTRKIDLPYEPNVLDNPAYERYYAQLRTDLNLLYDSDQALEWACEEMVAYALFTRGNPLKKIFNLVGSGNNGKSVFLQRLHNLAGPLWSTTLDAKSFCGRGDSSRANSGLVQAMRANLVAVEEPDKQDPMSAAQVKEYTGNTQIKARNLYENNALSQPNFMTLFICSNHPVKFTNTDAALLSRLERVGMPSKFFRSAAERQVAIEREDCVIMRSVVGAKYHVGDPNFAKRYEELPMRQVYFSYLKERYSAYVARGSLLPVPDDYSYRECEAEELEPESNDVYEELVEETGAQTDFMTCKALCALLKSNNTIQLGREMQSRIKKSTKVRDGRKQKQRGYYGIKPRFQAGNSGFGAAYAVSYDYNAAGFP